MEIAGCKRLAMQTRWLLFAVTGVFLTTCESTVSIQRMQGGTEGNVTASDVVVIDPEPGVEEAVPRPGNNGYKATNPSTVVLANGHPQLIEFYTDW